jgi:hypothetical protein
MPLSPQSLTSQVTDGVFQWRKIVKYDNITYSNTSWIFNGSLTTGLLRGGTDANANPYLTRFPVKDLYQTASVSFPSIKFRS